MSTDTFTPYTEPVMYTEVYTNLADLCTIVEADDRYRKAGVYMVAVRRTLNCDRRTSDLANYSSRDFFVACDSNYEQDEILALLEHRDSPLTLPSPPFVSYPLQEVSRLSLHAWDGCAWHIVAKNAEYDELVNGCIEPNSSRTLQDRSNETNSAPGS